MSSKQTNYLEGIVSQRLSESAVNNLETRGLGRFTTPLGYRRDGSPFYLIGGASPDDPSNDDGSGAGGNDSGSGDGGGSGSEGTGGDGTGNGADGNNSDTVAKAEYEKVLERMKAADRNAAAAAAKLKELEEKDLSEQEKVAKRLPELEQQVTVLAEENKGLKAKVAFLESSTHSWHDPEAALKLVDLTGVYNDEGELDKKALKKAMDDLAKEKTFLVKSSADNGGGGKGGQNGASGNGSGQGSSGSNVGGGGRGGNGNGLDEAALRKKYPALNL